MEKKTIRRLILWGMPLWCAVILVCSFCVLLLSDRMGVRLSDDPFVLACVLFPLISGIAFYKTERKAAIFSICISVLLLLAAILLPLLAGLVDARKGTPEAQLRTLAAAVESCKSDYGVYPNQPDLRSALEPRRQSNAYRLIDPWGNEYKYRLSESQDSFLGLFSRIGACHVSICMSPIKLCPGDGGFCGEST